MRDSSIVQEFLEEGRTAGREEGRTVGREEGSVNEARRIVLRLGISRLGPVDPRIPEYLNSISNIEELERLVEVIAEAKSWDELMPGS